MSVLRKLAGPGAIVVAVAVACLSCSHDPSELVLGKWRAMPEGVAIVQFEKDFVVFTPADAAGHIDTCSYRVAWDSLWIKPGRHARAPGILAYRISSDGKDRFDLDDGGIVELGGPGWYERIQDVP